MDNKSGIFCVLDKKSGKGQKIRNVSFRGQKIRSRTKNPESGIGLCVWRAGQKKRNQLVCAESKRKRKSNPLFSLASGTLLKMTSMSLQSMRDGYRKINKQLSLHEGKLYLCRIVDVLFCWC